MDLVLVADGAYPHDDYSFLPAQCKVWAGYVGGHTPHDWTPAEVAHLESTGRAWWGIWTAPVGRALTLNDAANDAAAMALGLARLGRAMILPVFWDVEESTYEADPRGAEDAADAWCEHMRGYGYPNAYWYGPCRSTAQWRACWDAGAPSTIPTGTVGIQYDHALDGDKWDASLFAAAIDSGGSDMPLTTADLDAIQGRLLPILQRQAEWVGGKVNSLFNATTTQVDVPPGLLLAKLANSQPAAGPVDVPMLATDLAAALGPDLGAQLVAALKAAL